LSAYVDWKTLEALAEQFDVARTTVIAILERHEVPRRYRLLAGETLRQAAELYAEGWSLASLGECFDGDPRTVQRTFKREGIPRRSSSG